MNKMADLTQNKAEEWGFLKQVYDLLLEENVLQTSADKPIVDFKFPDELQVSIINRLSSIYLLTYSVIAIKS